MISNRASTSGVASSAISILSVFPESGNFIGQPQYHVACVASRLHARDRGSCRCRADPSGFRRGPADSRQPGLLLPRLEHFSSRLIGATIAALRHRGNGPHMVTAGYVVLLTALVAGAGWGLWRLLTEFNR